MMVITVNPSQFTVNIFIAHRIRSRKSKNAGPVYDQDYVLEKLSGFGFPWEIHYIVNLYYEITKKIQERMK